MEELRKYLRLWLQKFNEWVVPHYFQLAVFNIFLVFLFLLRSAGYFHPFFIISVNFIVLMGLIVSIFLLGAGSRAMFLVTLFFWLFAAFFRIIKINVWAERTTIYAYQALVIGVLLLVFENIKIRSR